MKRELVACIAMALLVVGCAPYPRYTKHIVVAPRETPIVGERHTTDDYIRLGLILREYLGKPYRGKSKYQDGLDCSMFTHDVFRKFNRTILPRMVEEQLREGKEVKRSRLAFGDLLFFRTERRKISHVGIYIGYYEFIHASTSRGVVISNLTEKYWAERYAGARRILDKDSSEPTP